MLGRRKSIVARLKEIFDQRAETQSWYEELEDALIEGDIGPLVASEVVGKIESEFGQKKNLTRATLADRLRTHLSGYLQVEPLTLQPEQLNVFLLLGVNGVGKTTAIAKLAQFFRNRHEGVKIVLSAADTYRAAAIDQLKILGQQLGLPVIGQAPGADPGAVVYDSLASAQARGAQLVLVDTAGRMHNRANLVRELQKIDKVVRGRIGSGRYSKVLVIDATTGQNGLQQAETFHEAIGVDSIILAKYDSTAKGGVAVSICRRLGIPFSFLGTGEKTQDLLPFNTQQYVDSLLGIRDE